MSYRCAFLALAPLLYVQGKYVKRITPKLPEAEGARTGSAGQGPRLSVAIVGDSAAAGVGVLHQRDALSGALVKLLAAEFSVSWKLIANSGDTATQVGANIRAGRIGAHDVVVVSVGVNDVISLSRSAVWLKNLSALVNTIEEVVAAEHIYLSSIPPMQHFPALPNPLGWWFGRRATHFNELMKDFAARDGRCTFVDIPYVMNAELIASDGFHPGAEAYKLWGAHIAKLVVDDFLKNKWTGTQYR